MCCLCWQANELRGTIGAVEGVEVVGADYVFPLLPMVFPAATQGQLQA